MSIPMTVEEDIRLGLSRAKSHRNMNGSLIMTYNTNEHVKLPMNSLISKYRDFFDKYIDEVELTEEEQNFYRYSPKKFSQAMYGSTEYWSIILYINECHSIIDFEPVKIKYVVPESIDDILNEIMILEGKV